MNLKENVHYRNSFLNKLLQYVVFVGLPINRFIYFSETLSNTCFDEINIFAHIEREKERERERDRER